MDGKLKSAIVLFLGFLASCAAVVGRSNEYPENWPKVEPVDGELCPDLSGTYYDTARSTYDQDCLACRSLSNTLGGYFANNFRQQTTKVTQVGSNEIGIEVVESNQVVFNGRLLSGNGDFICNSEGVWVGERQYSTAEGVGYDKGKVVYGLSRAVDGSLIGQKRNTGFGMLLWIVPLWGGEITWFKWTPVEDSDPRNELMGPELIINGVRLD